MNHLFHLQLSCLSRAQRVKPPLSSPSTPPPWPQSAALCRETWTLSTPGLGRPEDSSHRGSGSEGRLGPATPPLPPSSALCLFGAHRWSTEGQGGRHGLCPLLGGPSVSPVGQASQQDHPCHRACHEHRLRHLLQLVGVAHQVPLHERKGTPTWLSADQPPAMLSLCPPPSPACSRSSAPT